jgi:hypothetical protein
MIFMINLLELKSRIDDLIEHLDDSEGYKLYSIIKNSEDLKLIQQDVDFNKYYLLLQFLIIPYLEINEIAELLKKDISIALNDNNFDLFAVVKRRLIYVDISERDECKKELKSALIDNGVIITQTVVSSSGGKLNTVNDWIKDFISSVNQKGSNSLAQAQYYQRPYYLKLSEIEKNKLRRLFQLYRYLSLSSLTPDGFEDDMLFQTKDGQLVTSNKSKIVVLYDPRGKDMMSSRTHRNYPEVVIKKKSRENETTKKLVEIEEIAAQFPAGSLERKAIEEEMKKLGG